MSSGLFPVGGQKDLSVPNLPHQGGWHVQTGAPLPVPRGGTRSGPDGSRPRARLWGGEPGPLAPCAAVRAPSPGPQSPAGHLLPSHHFPLGPRVLRQGRGRQVQDSASDICAPVPDTSGRSGNNGAARLRGDAVDKSDAGEAGFHGGPAPGESLPPVPPPLSRTTQTQPSRHPVRCAPRPPRAPPSRGESGVPEKGRSGETPAEAVF